MRALGVTALRAVTLAVAAMPLLTLAVAAAEAPQADRAAALDPERLALARDVQEAARTRAGIDDFVRLARDQYVDLLIEQTHASADRVTALVDELIRPALLARRDTLFEQLAEMYSASSSRDDLKAILTFYRSRAGQHFVAAAPAIIARSEQVEAAWATGIFKQVLTDNLPAVQQLNTNARSGKRD